MSKKNVTILMIFVVATYVFTALSHEAFGDDDDRRYRGSGGFFTTYDGSEDDDDRKHDRRSFFGLGSDDDDDRKKRPKHGLLNKSTGWRGDRDVEAVSNELYKKECGSCHFAYQPDLLPERGWKEVMAGLENHFGDNAELLHEDLTAITEYLVTNSAGKSGYKASTKIFESSINQKAPIRITETPYFLHEHDEIPTLLVKGNQNVKSFSHCARCHTGADYGDFNEHDVVIAGYGKWDD